MLQRPYIQLIGVPGSGKTTIENIIDKVLTVRVPPPAEGRLFRFTKILVVILTILVCLPFVDWRMVTPKKVQNTVQKLYRVYASHKFHNLSGEGGVTLLMRFLSVCFCSDFLFRIIGPLFIRLDGAPIYIINKVSVDEAYRRVLLKSDGGAMNRLFREKEKFRKRYTRLVDLAEFLLAAHATNAKIISIRTDSVSLGQIPGVIEDVVEHHSLNAIQ